MEELVVAEADAWNKGDAHAFSARCTEDISFTNIIGTSYYGLAAFESAQSRGFASFVRPWQLPMSTPSCEAMRSCLPAFKPETMAFCAPDYC